MQQLNSDIQPQRFIYPGLCEEKNGDSTGQGLDNNIGLLSLLQDELNGGNSIRDPKNEYVENRKDKFVNKIYAILKLIQEELFLISKEKFKNNIDEFIARVVILKQARTAFYSLDPKLEKSSTLFENTCVPAKRLFNENTGNPVLRKIENVQKNDAETHNFIIENCVKCISRGQKYINSFAVPIMIFNDSDSNYDGFWKKYIDTLSLKIYSIFIQKATLRLSNKIKSDEKNDLELFNNQKTFPDQKKKTRKDDKSVKKERKSTKTKGKKRKNKDDDIMKTINDEVNQIDDDQIPIQMLDHNETSIYDDDEFRLKDDIDNTSKANFNKPTMMNNIKTDSNHNEYHNEVTVKNEGNYDSNFDFLDYSPILTETCISLKDINNRQQNIPYQMKNLSYDLSHKLIHYFISDLKVISEKGKQDDNLFVFKYAAHLIQIMKLATSLLYESGAEIPPLSFIWKRIGNFKANFEESFFSYIDKFIIEQNIPFNFSRNSFVTDKISSDSINQVVNNFSLSSNFNLTNNDLDFIGNFEEGFGIDSISAIVSLIGQKRTRNIIQNLIQKLIIKTHEFCEKYELFIPLFNFKVDVSNESQNIYALKQHFNSFITYFSLPEPKDIASSISKIGNIIALIMLFDSAMTSEFTHKELISLSISSLIKDKDSKFSMYLQNPDVNDHRHNYLSDAIREMYQIINTPKTRKLFEEIDDHSAFYQFAISLIYASVHKQTKDQSQNTIHAENISDASEPTDSISIACSIILELLSQYDLYAFSNVIRTFILFKENMDANNELGIFENDINDLLNDSSQSKLLVNLQIVDTFHYALARSSFPTPNHLIFTNYSSILSEEADIDIFLQYIRDLLLYRCKKIAILININSEDKNKELNIFDSYFSEFPQLEILPMVSISISPIVDKIGSALVINPDFEFYDENENDQLISIIRSITHREYGKYSLFVFQKKQIFENNLKISKDFLLNLRGNFPYVIEDINFLTPKKGCNQMAFFSSPKNYFFYPSPIPNPTKVIV